MKSPINYLLNLFKESIDKGLSPLDLYTLLKINNKEFVESKYVQVLLADCLIEKEKDTYVVSKLGNALLTKLFSEKPQRILDPNDIKKYNELFPSRKLPSGKLARVNINNLIPAFRWFVDNFEYDWSTIMKATEKYVSEYALKGYKYMQTSQYFIRKQQSDRTWSSELANYCQLLTDGEDEDFHFKENVV